MYSIIHENQKCEPRKQWKCIHWCSLYRFANVTFLWPCSLADVHCEVYHWIRVVSEGRPCTGLGFPWVHVNAVTFKVLPLTNSIPFSRPPEFSIENVFWYPIQKWPHFWLKRELQLVYGYIRQEDNWCWKRPWSGRNIQWGQKNSRITSWPCRYYMTGTPG